jgi:carbamate kinase
MTTATLAPEGSPRNGLPRRVVVAFGGNALIRRGERGEYVQQRANVELAARAIATLARLVPEVIVTHGNGPQVGFLALQSESALPDVPAPPLDVLGAETQGQIGYMLSQALVNRFAFEGIHRDVAVVLTQVVVDADDPAFEKPTKPVGPVYTEEQARHLHRDRGWAIAPDNEHWRRVVPSPIPKRIVEAVAIRTLVESGVVVIASGGGGVPVVEQGEHQICGVEAVIDKDLAAVVLAASLEADGLILLTDVDAVYHDWGKPGARPLSTLSLAEADDLLADGVLPAGSMAPKVRACAQFVRAGGKMAAIGALDDVTRVLSGQSGTTVIRPLGLDRQWPREVSWPDTPPGTSVSVRPLQQPEHER